MAAGRPATPTELRKLSGSHPERINRREARFRKVESVTAPKIVSSNPDAFEEFNRVLPELIENGLLTRANLMIFASYCLAYAYWVAALRDVEERGRTLEEPVFARDGALTGHKEKANPAIAQAHQWSLAMKAHAVEFGMTPAASTKVQADPNPERKASFDDFAGGDEADNGDGALAN